MPSIMKIALPALALAGSAVAASCTVSATTTISNAADATALSSCSTFSGSIAIATSTTDDIVLDGIKKLSGNLVATNNSNMKRLSASGMTTLDGIMNLDGLTALRAVDFPVLKNVDSIKWNALPNLQSIGFTAQVEQAQKIDIQNTGLRSLKGINVQEVDTVFIANNGYIDTIAMQLGNVTTSLTLADNNENVKVQLTNLIWASNLTFRFCGSVEVPSLQTLNGSLGLYNNGFSTFAAPNLTTVGQALAFVANDNLSNLSFPLLTKVSGNLQLANNSALTTVDGFPLLTTIGGAFDMSGNMSNVTTSELDDVAGAFNLQSSENITSACSFYKALKDKKLIRGSYYCIGKVADPGSAGHTPSSSGNNNKASAATASAVNGALGLAAMAAVLLL